MRIAVIGRGLVGSAAARHLSAQGHEVVLIGPSEPADKAGHAGVFASHYDEGRITRGIDPWPFWARVSRASIARYRQIEAESGIAFYTERGILMAGPAGSAPIGRVAAVAKAQGIACRHFDADGLAARFPYFRFDGPMLGVFEDTQSGFISPRRLVAAQSEAARRNGATLVETVATGLREAGDSVLVETEGGPVEAQQALVAAGGFSNMVLPRPLDIRVYARTVALFEVSEAEAARLASMPPFIYLMPSGEDPYLLPPIRYPDGKWYLKLGGDPEDRALPDADAAKAWFRSGGSREVMEQLHAGIRARMPDLHIRSVSRAACVTTYTRDNIMALERVSDRVSVAVGGCGRGAKCSDELGRLGAEVVLGRDLPDWAREAAVA